MNDRYVNLLPEPEAVTRRLALIGCGRIGTMHAGIVAREIGGLDLVAVADGIPELAYEVAVALNVQAHTIEEVLADPEIDAVAICSRTTTHVDYIVAAAEAGKAIFCEKPVSLDLDEVDRALAAVQANGVPFMVAFNRRFDPGHRSVHDAVQDQGVGDIHHLRITSRDPEPPPVEYIATSGGIFLDMMIHDFDMAYFVTQSPVVEVFAQGRVRVDPRIGDAGDVDTAVAVLTHEDGTMTTIDVSRRAVYGFDQRIEAFGSLGMAVSDNPPRHCGWRRTEHATTSQPLPWFFLERYMESYRQEWKAFQGYLVDGGRSPAGVEAARHSTALALAAKESCATGRPVQVKEIG